jgi:hypothetical protein
MMRRAADRLRTSWAALLRSELDDVRTKLTTSWTSSFDQLRRDVVAERDAIDTRSAEHDLELVNALHRVATAFESIAESLESDRLDRRAQIDAVEFLMREMVLGFARPTAVAPVVLGGTVDPTALRADTVGAAGAVDIDLSDAPLAVGTLVEVRSRFHDHWVHGFAVTAYVPGPSRRGYSLRRNTDTEPLPLLFDTLDVRRAIAPSHPLVEPTAEPESSMWR